MSKANQKSRQQLDMEARRNGAGKHHDGFETCYCDECRSNVDRCIACGKKTTRIRTRTHERYCWRCGFVEKLDGNNNRIKQSIAQ